MFYVCFIHTADYGAANLFAPACVHAMTEDGRLCANEAVFVPPPSRTSQTF